VSNFIQSKFSWIYVTRKIFVQAAKTWLVLNKTDTKFLKFNILGKNKDQKSILTNFDGSIGHLLSFKLIFNIVNNTFTKLSFLEYKENTVYCTEKKLDEILLQIYDYSKIRF
jgi:hypothetical protein